MSIIDPCNRTRNVPRVRQRSVKCITSAPFYTHLSEITGIVGRLYSLVGIDCVCKTYCQKNFGVMSVFCSSRLVLSNLSNRSNQFRSFRQLRNIDWKLLSYRSISHSIEIKCCKSSDTCKKFVKTQEYFLCLLYLRNCKEQMVRMDFNEIKHLIEINNYIHFVVSLI